MDIVDVVRRTQHPGKHDDPGPAEKLERRVQNGRLAKLRLTLACAREASRPLLCGGWGTYPTKETSN
jgi:hypothetical protein